MGEKKRKRSASAGGFKRAGSRLLGIGFACREKPRGILSQ